MEESNNLLIPKYLTMFKSTCIKEIFILEEDEPDIQDKLNLTVFTEIINYRLVDDIIINTSYMNQTPEYVVILVKLKIYEIIKYKIGPRNTDLHFILNTRIKYLYMPINNEINGFNTKTLINKNKLLLDSYVEIISPLIIDRRCFYRYVSVMVYLE